MAIVTSTTIGLYFIGLKATYVCAIPAQKNAKDEATILNVTGGPTLLTNSNMSLGGTYFPAPPSLY